MAWRLVILLVLAFAVVGIGCSSDSSDAGLPDLEFMRFPDPATSPYCLPYPIGEKATVSQTWGDTDTHRGRFAIDFSMPFGAEITAARSGVVTEIRDHYSDDDRSGGHENGVFVLHEDGTMAQYLHMSEDGVLVEDDDEVEIGQVIGLVGTSGTAVPHLHFEVFEGQGQAAQWYRTVPVSFANTARFDKWGGLLRTEYESLPCDSPS